MATQGQGRHGKLRPPTTRPFSAYPYAGRLRDAADATRATNVYGADMAITRFRNSVADDDGN